MSSLLRHPGAVPSLFLSECDPPMRRDLQWRRIAFEGPLLALAGWTASLLIDVHLVRAATAAAKLSLPG